VVFCLGRQRVRTASDTGTISSNGHLHILEAGTTELQAVSRLDPQVDAQGGQPVGAGLDTGRGRRRIEAPGNTSTGAGPDAGPRLRVPLVRISVTGCRR
jgi:hypothetical protein